MAILASVPGVAVTIIGNGETVREYPDGQLTNTLNAVSRYIEVQTGQSFEVCIDTKPEAVHSVVGFQYRVLTDGNTADSVVVQSNNTKRWTSKGWFLNNGFYRPYVFNKFETGSLRPRQMSKEQLLTRVPSRRRWIADAH